MSGNGKPWPAADTLEISVEELDALRKSGASDYRLIDCREDDEWNVCRIDGAELMPLSRFGEIRAERLPDTAEKLIIHCHHGMRSGRAAEYLRGLGYKNTWSLAGGIEDWSVKIDPSVPRY